MSYAVSLLALSWGAASHGDSILKGTAPAKLPVEHPTPFEFVIHLKTAQSLGLAFSPHVLD
jgi:hypothetical protein